MKKALLPVVITAALPLTALADVTVYGKANVSLQNADEAGDTKIELVSNASRIGIKGGEEIAEGFKVIYQFEYQTEVDDGSGNNGQTFAQRNIYLGLQGKAGTVMGGHFDTPMKAAQEKIDLFNDLEGDIATILNGETRASNIVQYVTPGAFSPFTATVAYVTKENDDVDNGVSASFGYNTSVMYLGAAMDQDVQAEGVDIIRAVGRFKVGPVQLGALYETTDVGYADGDGFLVSALWNLTSDFALKAQYGETDLKVIGYNVLVAPEVIGTVFVEDNATMSVGADYKLSTNTTLYGYYTAVETADSMARDDNYLGIGLDLKF